MASTTPAHADAARDELLARLLEELTAQARQGRRLMEALVERLAGFLVELAAAEMDETFPY